MDRRLFAVAAGIAALSFAGAHPAQASQCTTSCDNAFQQCNGANNDASACLPKWGQCKRACSPPPAAPVTPAKAVTPVKATTPPVKLTKAANVKAKPTGKKQP